MTAYRAEHHLEFGRQAIWDAKDKNISVRKFRGEGPAEEQPGGEGPPAPLPKPPPFVFIQKLH